MQFNKDQDALISGKKKVDEEVLPEFDEKQKSES